MTFAIAIEEQETGCYSVFCLACRGDLGTMTLDIIRAAIAAKGPVLCPECRVRHCDFCGRITEYTLPFTGGHNEAEGFRVCPLCVVEKRNTLPPEYEKVVYLDFERGLVGEQEKVR